MNKPDRSKFAKVHSILERVKTYPLDFVFDFIKANPDNLVEHIIDGDNKLKIRRARIFADIGITCKCGLIGKFFALEKWKGNQIHFDLFAVDEEGDDVLMTIDHDMPSSKGGRNIIKNYKPMCHVCNSMKGDKII